MKRPASHWGIGGRGKADRRPNLQALRLIGLRWHYADNRAVQAVKHDVLVDDRRVQTETPLPQSVAQNRDGRALYFVIGVEGSAEHRRRSKDGKEIGGDDGAVQALRVPRAR